VSHSTRHVVAALLALSCALTASPADAGRPRPNPSGIDSDDFSASCGALRPFWTFVDPLGDGTLAIVEDATDQSHLELGVPAGTAHNIWTGGNFAPRVMQPANDTDFSLEVKFDSVPTLGRQSQGLLVEEVPGNQIRFEFFHDGASLRLYAASFVGNQPTVRLNQAIASGPSPYLRVVRTGNTWQTSYSFDGLSWTSVAAFNHAMAVSAVGLYVVNDAVPATASPAFTARVDYFANQNALGRVAYEDVLTNPSRTLTVQVEGSGSVQRDPDLPSYECGSDVLLTALPDPGHGFTGWSGGVTASENPLLVTLATNLSVVASFAPDTTPPMVSGVGVSVTETSAVVSWTTSEPATSQVAYGLTSGYELGSESHPALVTSHAVALGGLSAGTTYHYQITSVDGAGLPGQTGDLTFTTATPPQPAGIESEDWNVPCGALPAGWSLIDPVGDATLQIAGAGSGDAHLALSVPAGVSHTIWIPGNRAPRVMQAANDADFEVEVKFDSLPTQRFQGQGILVEQSPGNHVRFEIFHDGTTLRLYAASFVANSPTVRRNTPIPSASPLYMRVARSGNQWTQRYSTDGINWVQPATFTYVAAVSSIGLYALNDGMPASASPGFTALVDYFFDVAAPIVPEDDPGAIGEDPATLTVNITGNGTVQRNPDFPGYLCAEQVTLTAVPGTGQLFAGWSGDLTGAANPAVISMDQDRVVDASFVPDVDPPILSNVTVTAGDVAAIVSWTTSEPATSVVSFGPTPAYENGSVSNTTPKSVHSLTLLGLTPDTEYHFEARSVDGAGLAGSSGDLTFTTQEAGAGGPSGFDSDDFSAANLNPLRWSLVDPLSDTSVRLAGAGTENALLLLDVAGGPNHEVSAAGITAPRIQQSINDTDFAVDVKFQGAPTLDGQMQGLLVEEGGTRFLAVRLSLEGTSLVLLADTFVDAVVTPRFAVTIPTTTPIYLRLERAGDQWTASHSDNGIAWTPAGSFTHPMAASAISVFAGNTDGGVSAPAFTAAIDYVFDNLAPVIPEDGVVAPDVLPPLLQRIQAVPTPSSVQVSWVTDEPADSEVRFGLTPAYELGTVASSALVQQHAVVVPGLASETTYHFQVVSRDALGATSASADFTRTTTLDHSGVGPEIDVWYGLEQEFALLGLPQPWANVLGNVQDPDGVTSLSYTLNGGSVRTLRRGPDSRRLTGAGDFNADIPVADLLPGANTVVIRAQDSFGNVTTANVSLQFDGSGVWPLPYTADWSAVTGVQSAAQPVDGLWQIEGDAVRSVRMGYDRLLAIGDLQWTDYELTVPITINTFDPIVWDPGVIGAAAAVGVVMRWQGHTDDRGTQPFDWPFPFGAIPWYRIYPDRGQIELYRNLDVSPFPKQVRNLPLGVTHVFKMRVETIPGLGGLYSFKVWQEGQPEPAGWDLQVQEDLTDPQSGSIALLTHYVDASFGTVTVTPLP